MTHKFKKVSALLAALSLLSGFLTFFASTSASATTTPTGGTIRLISPTVNTATNGYDLQSDADNFVGLGYFPPGLTFKQTYVQYGSAMTLTYEARDNANALVTSGTMTLYVNKQYSNSNASFTTTSTNNVNGTILGTDVNVALTASIGSDGRATFNLTNTNVASDAESVSSLTSAPPAVKRYTQVIPAVSSLPQAGVDLTEFHFYDPAALPKPATSTLLTFETSDSVYRIDNCFGGEVASVVANAPAGNGSAKALLITKNNAQNWGGCRVAMPTDRKLTSSTNKVMTVNVYSPAAGQTIMFKLEPGVEVSKTTSVSGAWETMTVDFGTSANYSNSLEYADFNIFVQFGSAGNGQNFYFDDIAFNGATTPAISGGGAPQNPTVNYDVRLQSSLKNTSSNAYEWTTCGGASWCVNNNYYMKMIAAGASTTLSYVVTVHGTSTTVANATVHLRMNTAYSGSNATWSSGGTSYGAVSTSAGSDAGFITGTTDGSGQVSFTFANTNSSGEATRTLNNANPYPSGCDSPAGQTKGALQPEVTAVSGSTIGTQYVDVLWPHISSATINSSIAAGSDGNNCSSSSSSSSSPSVSSSMWMDPDNKGKYAHIRLEKPFLDTNFDASWWDGVWQYRDADTKAYLKYIPVGSTFKLTYVVTGPDNMPLSDKPVSLIVNANYACAKTFFMYENTLIGPDDCSGGGQTELPAKKTDGQGRVTFILTNTNTTGEAMPSDLNGLPNGKELGTNIKPHLVGATQEGIDMLFAHFVQPTEKATITAPAPATAIAGQTQEAVFTFTDENGRPMVNTEVSFMINGFNSRTGHVTTDLTGKAVIGASNTTNATGKQVVAVSVIRPGKLPLTASAVINWIPAGAVITASGAKGAVLVQVGYANGKTVKISVGGRVYGRVASSDTASFKIPASAGSKKVVVTVGNKTVTSTVTVSK